MARYKSADDAQKEHLEAFEPTLGPLYHALEHELTWLHSSYLPGEVAYEHVLTHDDASDLVHRLPVAA